MMRPITLVEAAEAMSAELDVFWSAPPETKFPRGKMDDYYVAALTHAQIGLHRAIAATADPFQDRVQPWLMACFGEIVANNREERNHRFLEEALELVQSCGCTVDEAYQLVDYVFNRPIGEKAQEVGGVMVTLAALCLAQDMDMHQAGETELARVWTKVDQIRAKQAAKPKHSPLPQASRETPAPQASGPMPDHIGTDDWEDADLPDAVNSRIIMTTTDDKPISDERLTLGADLFAYFDRKYVQTSDARQKSMGLQYTEAETHDLAKEVAAFILRRRSTLVTAEMVAAALAIVGPRIPGAERMHKALVAALEAAKLPIANVAPAPFTFTYKNYRGEVSTRRVNPVRVYFGVTEYHSKPQWLMEALDLDKNVIRAFAMADMAGWGSCHGWGEA